MLTNRARLVTIVGYLSSRRIRNKRSCLGIHSHHRRHHAGLGGKLHTAYRTGFGGEARVPCTWVTGVAPGIKCGWGGRSHARREGSDGYDRGGWEASEREGDRGKTAGVKFTGTVMCPSVRSDEVDDR